MTTRSNSGFSLVEVMCAILILGVALAGLAQGLSTALGSSKETEIQTTASLLAAAQIETLRAEKTLTDGETDGDCSTNLPTYHWRQLITTTDINGLHEVKVTIESTNTSLVIYELRTLLFDPSSLLDTTPKTTRQTDRDMRRSDREARQKDRATRRQAGPRRRERSME
jgi:prepilin-type N-terminal cleavage/methylation domain-containing protein